MLALLEGTNFVWLLIKHLIKSKARSKGGAYLEKTFCFSQNLLLFSLPYDMNQGLEGVSGN
jgi:hypothetical protein